MIDAKFEKLTLDHKESKKMYEKCKESIELKECYDNVFKVVSNYDKYSRLFNSGLISVGYGYMSVFDDDFIHVRHCFFISNKTGKVIDPTVIINDRDVVRQYYVVRKLNVSEYLNAINENDCWANLYQYLAKDDKDAREWAWNNGMSFCG